MKIVPNDLLKPTEKCIKVWNCSFIATEGPNILGKISLDDLEIPFTSTYRAKVTLAGGAENTLLSYGNIGEKLTYLMIKVTYDSENDPYYIYQKENYNITYWLSGSTTGVTYPIAENVYPIGRLMVLSGSDTNKVPRIFVSNPNQYPVTLDMIMANYVSETISVSGTTS